MAMLGIGRSAVRSACNSGPAAAVQAPAAGAEGGEGEQAARDRHVLEEVQPLGVDLVELGESFSPTRNVRVFAGYAGWSAGQLESEMQRSSWLTHPASLELIFDEKPEQLWKKILLSKGWKYKLLAEAPEDLSWN